MDDRGSMAVHASDGQYEERRGTRRPSTQAVESSTVDLETSTSSTDAGTHLDDSIVLELDAEHASDCNERYK